MVTWTAVQRPAGPRGLALVGLTGALLSGIGDVLILGRPSSGRDFDQAAGMVPPHIDADDRWRSLWNGAALPARRIHAGTLAGHVGIGLLQWLALRGISRTLPTGRERRIAEASATVFTVAGVLTHQCCGTVILAYKKAMDEALGSEDETRPSPRSATPLLAISTAATLGALAAYSASLTVAELRRGESASGWQSVVTPLPPVMVTLLNFGALPAPVGGYARPASISIGLGTYFAITAASSQRRGDPRTGSTTDTAERSAGRWERRRPPPTVTA
ncbi:hypothetical protein ICW40_14285 [Actinotalea ferrariae]|uniref:DUF6796 family protein n=1 Tax=Actinotalea ferrariae TaxID=1386098 RepID=UPI001C8C1F0A|nr:DUF6796 family protein [Actinotalea ferrariae]MBX9245973.1 hypothetical protein [Actinotalea ferrariae]